MASGSWRGTNALLLGVFQVNVFCQGLRRTTAYSHFFLDRTNLVQKCCKQGNNKLAYSKIFKIKEDKRTQVQKFSGAKRSKQRRSKTSQEQRGTNKQERRGTSNDVPSFSGMKRNKQLVFPSFSGTKRNKPNYSNTFQDKRGTNQFVLNFFQDGRGRNQHKVQKDQ